MINKQGVFTGNLEENHSSAKIYQTDRTIKPNLLEGTHATEVSLGTYPSSNYADRNIASRKTPVLNGTTYTLSFKARSTISGDKLTIHFYNPSNIIKVVGSQGQASSASDGNCQFTLSTNWEQYWVRYTIPANGGQSRSVIIGRLWSGAGKGTVYVKQEKVEENDIATTWIPNSADSLYNKLNIANLNTTQSNVVEINNYYEI